MNYLSLEFLNGWAKAVCILVFTLAFLFSAELLATTYHLDPINGSLSNSGLSQGDAWPSLEEVIGARYLDTVVRGGDELLLYNGCHGDARLGDYTPSGQGPLTIRSVEKWGAQLARLKGDEVHGLHVYDIKVLRANQSPCHYGEWGDQARGLINIWYYSSDIVIDGAWVGGRHYQSYNEWDDISSNGIAVLGSDNIRISNNKVENVYNGILTGSSNVQVTNNWVDNFVGDGLRLSGDHLNIENNLITDNYSVGGVHSDGIQFYAPGEVEFSNIRLSKNIIINVFDRNRPFVGHLQIIGAFDNPFRDLVVENTFGLSETTHGISFSLPVTNGLIRNNTIVGIYGDNNHHAKIKISGSGNHIVNNLATAYVLGGNYTENNNILVSLQNFSDIFAGSQYDIFNLRGFNLKTNSIARDAGDSSQNPGYDVLNNMRFDGRVDIGAQEIVPW